MKTVSATASALTLPRWQSFCMHLLVLSGYLLLSIALTWPLVVHWHTGIVGGMGHFTYDGSFEDGFQNIWNIWWTRQALEQGQNPFWTDMLYYPEGVQMYLQTMNITNALLTLPVQYLFGPVAAYNTAMLLAFTLTGYAGFLLTRAFVPDTRICFLCGALLTACPFHMLKLQVNQLNLVSIQWLPLYFLALYRLEHWPDEATKQRSDEATKRRADDVESNPRILASSYSPLCVPIVFAIAMFMLVVLTDWYWALVCGVYTIVWFGVRFAQSAERWQLLRHYSWFGGGVLVCLLPLVIGMAQIRDRLPTTDVMTNRYWQGYIQGFSADAFGLLFPAALHPLWDEWAQQTAKDLSIGYGPDGWYVAAGWVLMVCATVGVWRSWQRKPGTQALPLGSLLLVGGSAWLLSLGPTLRILGIKTGIPMPFAFMQNLPVLSTGRRPSHFAVVCIILAVVLAGVGLYSLQQTLSSRHARLMVLGVTLLAIIELWPPSQRAFFPFELPDFLYELREVPGAVADLPLEHAQNSRSLRHQIAHAQPILGGFVARRPQQYRTLRDVPLYQQIGSMQRGPEQDIVSLSQPALAAMQCYIPIRHVIVTRSEVTDVQMQELEAVLTSLNDTPLTPRFADDDYVWYELPLFADQCAPFLYLGAGWHNREYTDQAVWRWATASSTIWLVNPFAQPILVTVRLRAESFADGRPLEVWQAERMIARWEVGRAMRDYRVVVQVPPGAHPLELRTIPARDQQSEREVSLAVTEIAVDSYARWEQ